MSDKIVIEDVEETTNATVVEEDVYSNETVKNTGGNNNGGDDAPVVLEKENSDAPVVLEKEEGPGDEKKKELSSRAKKIKETVNTRETKVGKDDWQKLKEDQKKEVLAKFKEANPSAGADLKEVEEYYKNEYQPNWKKEFFEIESKEIQDLYSLTNDDNASEYSFYKKDIYELDDNDFEEIVKFKDVKAIKKEKVDNDKFLTLLTDISKRGDYKNFEARNKAVVEQDISKEEFERVKKRAESQNIDLDEAARMLGYQVNVDAKLDEDEDGFITGRYSIQKGDKNPLGILNNRKTVNGFLDDSFKYNNLKSRFPDLQYEPFVKFFNDAVISEKTSFGGWGYARNPEESKQEWIRQNYERLKKENAISNYENFINYLNASPVYGSQIYNYVNSAGDNILQNEQAEQVINYLNGGVPEDEIAGTVAWDKIKQVEDIVWKKGGIEVEGGYHQLQEVQRWVSKHSDGKGGFDGKNITNEEIDKFLEWTPVGTVNSNVSAYYGRANWGLSREILRDPEKLKVWYAAKVEEAVGYDINEENFNYLYDKNSGRVFNGDEAYIITKKEQLLKSGTKEEDIIEVSSKEEYAAKMKEIRTNLLNFYPEKRGDLSGIVVQSYYNIIGLQEDLIKNGVITGNNYAFFDASEKAHRDMYNTAKANVQNGKLTAWPKQLPKNLGSENLFLIEKYNEEVAKFNILSKSYVLNFNPSSIEKQGFWSAAFETIKEGTLGKVSNELFGTSTAYVNSDEARQDFYNTYVATDPKLKKVFTKKDVDELYDKTFLAKAGSSLPDFLVIMAEFAITRKLSGKALKALGQMTEVFLSGSKISKAAPFIGSFVEELAAISLVNSTFNQDMSLLFAVTGPVGKMIDDFYKAFLNPKATGMYAKVGKVIKAQPQAVRIAEDGILKLGTSGVVMKIGEVPEAIIHSIQEGDISHLAHVFDPEEFAVLLLQLTAVKGIAPIKGVVDVINTGYKEISSYTKNKKYKSYIDKYEKLMFKKGYESPSNKKSRIYDIETAAAKKLKELGVNSRLINTLAKGGLSFKQVEESKTIEDLLKKIEGNVDGVTYNKIKNAIEAGKKAGITIDKIKKASEIVDAKNGLKLNAEYDAFLKSVENEASTGNIVKEFAEKAVSAETMGTKKPLVLDVNTIKAIKKLNSPTLIARVLDSYGVKPDAKTGKYKDPMLNFLLEKGKQVEIDGVMTDTYPNLSYVNMAFEKASKENVNLETPTGQAYVKNIIEEINLSRTEARIKAEMAADPGINKESFEKDLESIKEQKESLMRSRQGIVDKAQSENVTSELNLIEKVKTEKEELGIDDIITVDNQLQLQKFVQGEVNKIDKQLSKLDREIKRTTDPNKKKELEAKKDGLLKDKSQFEAELNEYSKDAKSEAADGVEMLNKGKAIETSDGRKVVVFNVDAIFKSGGAGVTAHELLHPFVNQKLRELGLANNSVKQKRFIQSFTRGLNDNAISSIERRLVSMGILKEGNKLLNEDGTFSLEFDNLNGKQRLEIFNAYAEGIVLGEIGWESGSKEFKQATEAFEAFLETEAGSKGSARDMTVTEDAFRIYINEYVKQVESFRGKENLTDRERLAVMISKEETLKEGELSPWVFQSSKEASGTKGVKLEDTIRTYEDKIKNVKKGEEHLIPGYKRNIATCKKLLAKSDKLDEAFLTIENAISEGGFKNYKEMKSNKEAALSVRQAEARITLLANAPPNGPLFKLKEEFDPTKVDSKYNKQEVEFFKEEWNAQADVYFSMSIRRYVDTRRKVMEETGNAYPTPFEAYMVKFVMKKGNLIEKTQDLEFNKRFQDASENGEVYSPGTDTKNATSHLKSPDEVNLHVEKAQEYESPFKFSDEVKNQTSKTILSLGTVEAKNEKAFNKEIDNTIRIFMTDAVFKSSFTAKNKSGNMSFDLKTAETNLKNNYDFVSRYIEGNSAWLRLRNFDLFYNAQLTDGGNVVRKGKAEEPVYITEMPKLDDYIDFFLAQGEFAPKGNQKASNIRSQRLKKLAELYARIEVGNQMANVMQNGGNVVINGKTVMPAITSSNTLARVVKMQESSYETPVDDIAVDNIIQSSKEVRNSFVKTINNENFLNEVQLELLEDFKITPIDLTNYNNARISNQEIIELTNGREIKVDEVSEIINIATSNVIKSKIKDDGKGGSMITKSIEISNQSSPKKVKDFTADEAKVRKEIALKSMEINNYAGITREQANKNKESDATNFYDPRTKKFDVEKYYKYIDNLKIISEYGLSVDAAGGTTSVAKMLGDHIRINASGKLITDVTFDGINVDAFEGIVDPSTGRVLNVYEAIMFRHPNHVPGSKNVHLGKVDLSKITNTSDMATLNTFLKIDPKELDVDHMRLDEESGEMIIDKVTNSTSTKIRNLLKKLDIDYNDPNAKQQVLDIVLNNKHNITRTRAMRAKMLGVYEMFWSKEINNEQLGDIFSTWVKAEFKGNSNNKYGSRLLASNSAAEVNNMKLVDVHEKVEHGYDIGGLMRDIVPDIVNGNKKAMLEKLEKYEMYHFDRNKLNKMDDTPGIGTNPVVEGIDPSAKILYDPTNAGITYIRVDGKNVKVSDYVNEIVTTTLQSSKEKKKVYKKVEHDYIEKRVTEIILGDGNVKKNEIPPAVEQAKKEIEQKIEINNQNQKSAETDKNIKVEAGKSEVVKNAATPENNISNAQLIDQGNKTNWNEDVVIETPNGEIKYDAGNNTVTSPNNTGKFSPKKKVVLLAGGAGSGKGTTWKNIVKDHPELAELEIINSDTDKQRLKKTFELGPNEKGYNTEERSLLSQITGLSVKEAKLRREELIAEGNGFVLDGTLASYRSNSKLIKQLKDKGYDVQIVYTKANVEVASKRNANRKERSIKDGLLRRNHDQVNETIELFKKDGETIIEINGEKAYIKGDGDVSFNTLNSTVKSEIKPDAKTNALLEENGVQSSKEYYEKESDRIISKRYDLEEGPIDPAVADKASKQNKRKFKLMSFKAQQAFNLYLEVVGKGDTKALDYMEGGVDLATKGRLDFGSYSVNARQSIKQITKGDKELKLNEKSGIKGGWTRSEAIRMFMFYRGSKTKSINDLAKDLGVKVETLTEAYEYVKNDQKLLDYANNLVKSVNVDGKGWVEPYEGWARGSLKYDIHKAIESRRAHYMDQFNEWHTITFSKKNMDKIKAGMSEKDFESWKVSVEDFHDRAITGRTRATGERIGQKWVNWLHGSTALALFGNRKSMMTQLISTTNFFGAKNNGVIEAGLAYGNPEIFDMMRHILNSNYLKDRRGSYDLALKELNELQNRYGDMYKKGINLSFLLSQLGDNAAIVVGGSSMLLNNYKALMKANPEITKEQAMDLAMEEVAMHSERTQQSTFAENLTYQQTKAIGKVTLNFLNTQIRYNNIALEEMKKIKKGVSKDITKSVAKIINYTGLQVGTFAFLSSGMQYLLMDDEANYEDGEYDELVQNKKSKIIMDGMNNIIKGTGISGQAVVTMIGMVEAVIKSSTATDYQKQQAQLAKKALQVSPALSIKYSKLEHASYKVREAMKAYKEGTGWRSPALEATTKVFSAATNIAAPEYVFSLIDQYQFIMDERYSFWQHFGVAMGWSPYSMDPDFYKNKKLKNKSSGKKENITIGAGTNVPSNQQYKPKNKDIIIGG